MSVFSRALGPDIEPIDLIETFDDLFEPTWSDWDVMERARRMVAEASEGNTTPADAVSTAASEIGRSPCVWIGSYEVSRFGLAGERLVDTLNQHPTNDALAAWYLAPVVRMIVSPAPGPEWLFGFLTLMRISRRRRPWLVFRGAPELSTWSAPVDYGWENLENWVLRVWCREPLTLADTDKRLPLAVEYAAHTLRDLTRRAPSIGPVALDFEDVCRPLRRCLHWYATAPLGQPERRVNAQRLLRTLTNSLVPALPPREPVILEYHHATNYEFFRQTVAEVWRATRSAGTIRKRRSELERRHNNLEPVDVAGRTALHPRIRELKRMQDRFWRDCGDLAHAEPGHVARCYMKQFMRIELEPRRIKELLANVDALPPYRSRPVAVGRRTWREQSFPPLGY